jgi:hypothetical protein
MDYREPRYNVETNRNFWATTKASLMPADDRKALMAELIKLAPQNALDVLGDLISTEHGARCEARRRANGQ